MSEYPPVSPEFQIEQDLQQDLMMYGSCYYKIVDGKKVRIHPMDVYIKTPWWRRLWYWLLRTLRG